MMEEKDKGALEGNEESATKASEGRKPRPWVGRAIIAGAIFTLAAWIAFFFDNTVALVCAAMGLLLSCGIFFSGKGCRRDIGITAFIASAILLIIYALFYFGLDYVTRYM